MQIILQQNFPTLGYVGEKVAVRPGYARNFLIPRGIAVEVGSLNSKQLRHQLAQIEAKRKKMRSEAEALGGTLTAVTLEFTLKVGEKGKSFGSVAARDIERSFKEKGFELERKQIRLVEPIRGAGDYKVMVRLHSDVEVEVPVHVTAEAVQAHKAEKDERKPRGRKGRGKKEGASEDSANEVPAPEKQEDAE